MPKHVRVDTLCATECIFWTIYWCMNMQFRNNIKFQIKNLAEFVISILELFQLLQMKVTQNISMALQCNTNATISGKWVVQMLKLLTTFILSEEETAASHDKYRVIHKSLRNFRTRLRNNQDRQDRKEHINRQRISKSFFYTRGLGVLAGSTARG